MEVCSAYGCFSIPHFGPWLGCCLWWLGCRGRGGCPGCPGWFFGFLLWPSQGVLSVLCPVGSLLRVSRAKVWFLSWKVVAAAKTEVSFLIGARQQKTHYA